MIVSLLQLMGFPKGKPVHSPAESERSTSKNKASAASKAAQDSGTDSSARRQDVKTKHSKASPQVGGKAAVPAKAAKSAGAKTVAKAAPVKAAVPKTAAKPATKPATPAKSAKSAAPATKSAKPIAKAAAAKSSSAKVTPKKEAATKSAAKPGVKTVAKAPSKAAAKPIPAPAKGKAVTVKAVAKPAATIAPAPSPAPKAAAKVAVAPKAPTAPVVVAAPVAPTKAPRPSSRLAQVTVPSMAQSVASTAPKASFTPFKESPVIAPAASASIKKDPKLANNWKNTSPEKLTDAELMAMPDAEYMNEVQLAAFRYRLVALKQGILNNAGETTEHLREDTSIVPDPADRATIEEEHALELRTRDRERKLLKKIEMSIARIDAGDYGYCDETGEPIGVGRLLARPTATLSLEAQQRRELKQKMYGD